jgi:hypothetical protein
MSTNFKDIDKYKLHLLPKNTPLFLEDKTKKTFLNRGPFTSNSYCGLFIGFTDDVKEIIIQNLKAAIYCTDIQFTSNNSKETKIPLKNITRLYTFKTIVDELKLNPVIPKKYA